MEATTDVTFASNWGNLAGTEECRYYKDPFGIVHIEGYAARNTSTFTFNGAGSTIFTLPVGYRPEKIHDFLCRSEDGTRVYPGSIRVDSNGVVVALGPGGRGADGNAATATASTIVSLDGITFRPSGV